jgi:hypothetical protein
VPLRSTAASPSDFVYAYVFGPFTQHNIFPLLEGGLLAFFQAALIASFSLSLSTFFPPVVVATGTLAVYVIGHTSDLLFQSLSQAGPVSLIVGQLVHWVLPNLGLFNPTDHLARGEPVSTIYIALAFSYGILYVSVVLGTTSFAFSRRELP